MPDSRQVFSAAVVLTCIVAAATVLFAGTVTVPVRQPWVTDQVVRYDHEGFIVIHTGIGWIWVDGTTSSLSHESEQIFPSAAKALTAARRHSHPSRIYGSLIAHWNLCQHWDVAEMTGPDFRECRFSPSDYDADGDVDLKDFAIYQRTVK